MKVKRLWLYRFVLFTAYGVALFLAYLVGGWKLPLAFLLFGWGMNLENMVKREEEA